MISMHDLQKKVLFISYIFPPIGGSGVQRNLKYVKYLPRTGWQPLVITVKDVISHSHDYSLLDEIPADAVIVRTESVDPFRIGGILRRQKNSKQVGSPDSQPRVNEFRLPAPLIKVFRTARSFVAFPDSVVGWMPFVIAAGIKLFRQHHFQVIFARSVPYTGAIAALLLSKLTRRPYVLDFADGWTDDPHLNAPTVIHKKMHALLERMVVGRAHHVIVYSDNLAQKFKSRYPQIADQITVLPNGYDPEDLAGVQSIFRKDKSKQRIVYTGNLYEHQLDNFVTLLEALNRLLPHERGKIEILFVGKVHFDARSMVEQFGLSSIIRFLGYKTHSESLRYLASADAALLFIKEGDITMVTGKLFEYLGMQLPIIAIIEPEGLAAHILNQVSMGEMIVHPRDVEGLLQIIQRWMSKNNEIVKPQQPQAFNRKYLTEKLATVLEDTSNQFLRIGDSC